MAQQACAVCGSVDPIDRAYVMLDGEAVCGMCWIAGPF
jgi:hypothetical protein